MSYPSKQSLRAEMLSVLKQSPRPDLPVFDFEQKTLIAYIPMKTEVNTVPMIDYALQNGKTVAVPTDNPELFAVLSVNWHDKLFVFKDKSKGVYSDEFIFIDALEDALMLVPGLAFSEDGYRLGRGGGFYDRVIRRLPSSVKTAGICRKCQILKDLPLEPHDRKVDYLIST